MRVLALCIALFFPVSVEADCGCPSALVGCTSLTCFAAPVTIVLPSPSPVVHGVSRGCSCSAALMGCTAIGCIQLFSVSL
jgi:hypothetical protein